MVLEAPTAADLAALKRLVRYLLGTRNFVIELKKADHYDDGVVNLDVYTDSDWADDPITRRSRSSSHVEADGVHMFDNSTRQGILAKSSCEAEWYGGSKGVSDAFGLKTLFEWLGYEVRMRWHCDSSSARALSKKLGVGRVKHIAIHTLWLQELVARKILEPVVVASLENKADMGSKYIGGARLATLRASCGIIDPEAVASAVAAVECTMEPANLAHQLLDVAYRLLQRK